MTNRPSPRQFGFETRMVHAGHVPDAETGARAVPIYQTTSYVFHSPEQAAQLFELKQYGDIYTRISNPTTAVLEERIASLEGATGAVAVAGGTVTQLSQTLKKLSVKVTLVDPRDFPAWEKAITPKTRALYGETIGNPRGSIFDIEKYAGLAAAHDIPLIIDNTFATPYLCRPIEFGATIVLHSATKFIGGHGSAIGGVILDSGKFDFSRFPAVAAPSPSYHGLRFFDTFGHYGFLMKARAETVRDVGACISPMNSFLILQGLETLSLRMERHVANAQKLAEYLRQHEDVAWVAYAGLPDHPDYALAQKYLPKGPGAVFSFGLKGEGEAVREEGRRFIESLQLFSHLANVGDVRSLVIHPASTTHQQLTESELAACGVGPEMIRLSVGLENVEDLLWDLDQAFHARSRSTRA
jgi:O-acetylhomoserine (thiol)-lyase